MPAACLSVFDGAIEIRTDGQVEAGVPSAVVGSSKGHGRVATADHIGPDVNGIGGKLDAGHIQLHVADSVWTGDGAVFEAAAGADMQIAVVILETDRVYRTPVHGKTAFEARTVELPFGRHTIGETVVLSDDGATRQDHTAIAGVARHVIGVVHRL